MTDKEAIKLALDALENSVDLVVEDAYNAEQLYGNYPTRQGKVGGLKILADQHKEAITALKERLAQPEQEPVAWNAGIPSLHPKMKEGETISVEYVKLTPPQRKPLTLGQKQRLWSSVGDKPTLKDRVNAYGLAIEAAHGIKENA